MSAQPQLVAKETHLARTSSERAPGGRLVSGRDRWGGSCDVAA